MYRNFRHGDVAAVRSHADVVAGVRDQTNLNAAGIRLCTDRRWAALADVDAARIGCDINGPGDVMRLDSARIHARISGAFDVPDADAAGVGGGVNVGAQRTHLNPAGIGVAICRTLYARYTNAAGIGARAHPRFARRFNLELHGDVLQQITVAHIPNANLISVLLDGRVALQLADVLLDVA